jgi:hypothetical protein
MADILAVLDWPGVGILAGAVGSVALAAVGFV